MPEPETGRRLIPDERIVVVLDTAPVRGLAYFSEAPPWVATFAQMAQYGYWFTLADATLSELLVQRHRGALSADDCRVILQRLQLFLSLEIPMLPGKKDLAGMLGINDGPWDEDECRALSRLGLQLLTRCADPNDQQPTPEWALEEERDDWKAMFAGWKAILDSINAEDPTDPIDAALLVPQLLPLMESKQNNWNELVPPMSVRMHLQNRDYLRQFVRMQKKKEPYDPASNAKRNDGIDADLYRYLLLPALVVTEDNAFLRGLSDIASFQKSWFYTPQQLADEWLRGERPAPTWP